MQQTWSFDLREFYDVLFRRRGTVFFFFFLVLLAVLLAIYLWPESYRAEARLLVKVGRENAPAAALMAAPTPQQVITGGVRKEDINTEIAILTNWELAGQVVDELGVATLFPEQPPPATLTAKLRYQVKRLAKAVKAGAMEILYRLDLKKRLSERQQAVAALHKRLKAELQSSSDVIRVEVRWGDPEVARVILAKVLDLYLAEHLEAFKPRGGYSFLEEQVRLAKERLTTAEDALQRLKAVNGIVDLATERRLQVERRQALKAALEQVDSDLAAVNREIAVLTDRLAATKPVIEQSSEVARNPVLNELQNKLVSLELERQRLARKFPGDSRPLVTVRQAIDRVKELLAAERTTVVSKVVQGRNQTWDDSDRLLLQKKVAKVALEARRQALAQQLAAASKGLAALNNVEVAQARLLRQVEIENGNYTLYRKKLEEARISEALDRRGVVNVRVIGAPVAFPEPVAPKKLLGLGLGVLLGLVGGIALALLFDYFDHSIRTTEDVRRHLDLPVLGSLAEEEA